MISFLRVACAFSDRILFYFYYTIETQADTRTDDDGCMREMVVIEFSRLDAHIQHISPILVRFSDIYFAVFYYTIFNGCVLCLCRFYHMRLTSKMVCFCFLENFDQRNNNNNSENN